MELLSIKQILLFKSIDLHKLYIETPEIETPCHAWVVSFTERKIEKVRFWSLPRHPAMQTQIRLTELTILCQNTTPHLGLIAGVLLKQRVVAVFVMVPISVLVVK